MGHADISSRFLRELAHHTDGIGWVQLMASLWQRGVWRRLAEAKAPLPIGVLSADVGANLGYLNVALRVLDAQGWVERELSPRPEQTRVRLAPLGRALDRVIEDRTVFERIGHFVPVARRMREHLDGAFEARNDATLEAMVELSGSGWRLAEVESEAAVRLTRALDGNLLGPVAVALKQHFGAVFEGRTVAPPDPTKGPSSRWRAVFEMLTRSGWLERCGEGHRLTDYGEHAYARASSFGVPVSYLALFERVDELMFGEPRSVWRSTPDEAEHLVDRVLNVTSSGATHHKYFRAADEIIRAAFDRPFEAQPLGFCDMGSGDGAWLEHIWHVISTGTERGRLMRAYPDDPTYRPLLVGADFSREALQTARERLSRANIPHLLLPGDINDPHRLAADLERRGIDIRDLMHGNSFLIHNRPYQPPSDRFAVSRRRAASPGAYVWRDDLVSNAELQQNLVEFMRAWGEVIGRHGFLVIELHDPETVDVGRTLTNYIMTHGFSNQFTVPVQHFLDAAAEAGLTLDAGSHRLYPSDPQRATVSVSYFVGDTPARRYDAASALAPRIPERVVPDSHP